jgi:hypothetical protein
MSEAFKGCLVSISTLSDAALEDRVSTISNLLDAIRREEKTATGAYRCALSAVANYLWLLGDQSGSESADRKDRKELERCRQILAGAVPPSQENEKGIERQCDHDRLLKKIEDTEELIRLRQSATEAVEGELSALSAIQIDSYLAVAGIPAHDPLRLALNGQGINVSKATESPSETSIAQNFKTFAAETFIGLTAKYGRKGVPAEALRPFADQCDARKYKINSDFLRDRVLKAIDKYNVDFSDAQIENYSNLVEMLVTVALPTDSVKKRQKNSRQELARKFRVWLYEMKRDYLKKQPKKSK